MQRGRPELTYFVEGAPSQDWRSFNKIDPLMPVATIRFAAPNYALSLEPPVKRPALPFPPALAAAKMQRPHPTLPEMGGPGASLQTPPERLKLPAFSTKGKPLEPSPRSLGFVLSLTR
jgi:hypothetical protein